MKELETITIGKTDYAIVNEVKEKETRYVYLVNPKKKEDIMIRKSSKEDNELWIPLEDEEEYHLACMLLMKKFNEKSE